jgi:hypothetical protein
MGIYIYTYAWKKGGKQHGLAINISIYIHIIYS